MRFYKTTMGDLNFLMAHIVQKASKRSIKYGSSTHYLQFPEMHFFPGFYAESWHGSDFHAYLVALAKENDSYFLPALPNYVSLNGTICLGKRFVSRTTPEHVFNGIASLFWTTAFTIDSLPGAYTKFSWGLQDGTIVKYFDNCRSPICDYDEITYEEVERLCNGNNPK